MFPTKPIDLWHRKGIKEEEPRFKAIIVEEKKSKVWPGSVTSLPNNVELLLNDSPIVTFRDTEPYSWN